MALDSSARARWSGDLMSGSGTVTLDSGAADTFDVDWKARSEDHGGKTSPEELIAAAHATCFAMALSHALGQAGTPPASLSVSATVTFVPGQGITGSALTLSADVPGLGPEDLAEKAQGAKENCPVSKALSVPISLAIE